MTPETTTVEPGPVIQLVVTSGGDTTNPGDGVLTLREAIADQAAAGLSATISFAAGVTAVELTQGELAVTGTSTTAGVSLTIDGGSGVSVTQVGTSGGRVLHVAGVQGVGAEVTLEGLTLSGGSIKGGYGGGLLAENANLTLNDVTVAGNSATLYRGGLGGGGVGLVETSATITGGAIAENKVIGTNGAVSGPAIGGGIFATNGDIDISGTRISGNELTAGYGGALGGGIYLRSVDATLDRVTLAQNSATNTASGGQASGGGVFADQASNLDVSYATVTGNEVTASGVGRGGGLYAGNGLSLAHSLVAGNDVGAGKAYGGGVFAFSTGTALDLGDSTITANTLTGGNGYGGGIAIAGGALTITSATVAGNAGDGAQGIGGIDARFTNGTSIANSIVAGNTGATTDVSSSFPITSDGHNLFSQATVEGTLATDIVTSDPGLGPLADNGGPTQTLALLDGSPALDAGSSSDVDSLTDQRGTGFARISGTDVDIGAFERQTLGGVERLFTPGDDIVDLRKLDLALYPGTLGTQALAGDDTVQLSSTQNLGTLFVAGRGDDIVFGGARGDKITGSQGDDRIGGGGGDDLLYGGVGNDRLHGDGGKDTLKGSAGADTFIFTKAGDSPTGAVHDVILDFTSRQGDLVDLAKIDANAGLAGNQAFVWKGVGPLTGVGQLHYRQVGGDTIVEGNVSGSAAPEIQIELHGHLTLAAGDFLL